MNSAKSRIASNKHFLSGKNMSSRFLQKAQKLRQHILAPKHGCSSLAALGENQGQETDRYAAAQLPSTRQQDRQMEGP